MELVKGKTAEWTPGPGKIIFGTDIWFVEVKNTGKKKVSS